MLMHGTFADLLWAGTWARDNWSVYAKPKRDELGWVKNLVMTSSIKPQLEHLQSYIVHTGRVCETLPFIAHRLRAVMGSSMPQISRPKSAQDWEALKATIEQLYCRQRRPLREVVKLMAERHGFLATYISYSWAPAFYGLLPLRM
jgi:hypothetical protein